MQPQNGPPAMPDPRDELAGVYVEITAEEQIFLPPDAGEPRPQREPGWTPPTTQELAGVSVYIEAEEQIFLPPTPPSGSAPATAPGDPSSKQVR